MTATEAAPGFFLALVAILLACRGAAWVCVRIGQPPVVGEMIAGVLLGPSLLGLLLPGAEDVLFPVAGRPLLYTTGQIGLVVFMFAAGYEFDPSSVRGSGRGVLAISLSGTAVPLLLGGLLTLVGGGWAGVLKPGVPLGVSVSFVAVALAITAFPMMARIISERGIGGTRFGSLALACGALDDVLAWLLLAGVLAASAHSAGPVVLAFAGVIVFGVLIATVGRPLLARLVRGDRGTPDSRLLATVIVLFAAAWFTDQIGLYAVFGAFCVGLVFPRTPAADAVLERLVPVNRLVFLPLFFTYSGLNTRFGLLAQPALLGFAALCVLVAVVGKFGACWGAARLSGEPNDVAVPTALLMNARGLMQLIALNVGLQAGIVSNGLFTVLVLVALVTTVMTTPCLAWFEARRRRVAEPVPEPEPV